MSVVRPDRANEFIQFLAGKQIVDNIEITHDWCITIIFNMSMHFKKVPGACLKLHLQCLIKPKLREMCCSSSTFCRCH